MGVPAVPLARLYSTDAWRNVGNVEILPRTPVQRVLVEDGKVRALVDGRRGTARPISTSAPCLSKALPRLLPNWLPDGAGSGGI